MRIQSMANRGKNVCPVTNMIDTQAAYQMAADKRKMLAYRDTTCTNLSVTCPYEIIVYTVVNIAYNKQFYLSPNGQNP